MRFFFLNLCDCRKQGNFLSELIDGLDYDLQISLPDVNSD